MLGCAHMEPVQTTFDPAYPERNDAGDPIVAVFQGRIPCAVETCEMRKIELVLYGREGGQAPTTYWLGQLRVGMGNDRLVQEGVWAIRRGVQDYPGGLVFALDSEADPTLRYLWRVNDEVALVLDSNLKPRAGNAAWGFMLTRDCEPYGPRSYAYNPRTKQFIGSLDGTRCPAPAAQDKDGTRSSRTPS
jgi:hypothetical protein